MMAKIDLKSLAPFVEEGYITCRPHPTASLYIFNYTAKTQWERNWTPETRMCRGLIIDLEGNIVARPFPKFFNWGEVPEQVIDLNEPFKVTMKMDGSLGILYHVDGEPFIATRGSFTSEQAVQANRILREKYGDVGFNPDYTYLFEIIYPGNRIVVDYDDMEDLVLLAIIETETGHEINIHGSPKIWPFPLVKHYDGLTDFEEIQQIQEQNEEGFVIRFEKSGLRLKIKFEEYKRLHKIMTQTSNRTIWEYLKENKPLAEILDRVPPEFETWVKKISKELGNQYLDIHRQVEATYKDIVNNTTVELPTPVEDTLSATQFKNIEHIVKRAIRDRFAEHPAIEQFLLMKWDGATKYYYPDGRRVTDKKAALRLHIWDSLYPAYSRPFMLEDEEA